MVGIFCPDQDLKHPAGRFLCPGGNFNFFPPNGQNWCPKRAANFERKTTLKTYWIAFILVAMKILTAMDTSPPSRKLYRAHMGETI